MIFDKRLKIFQMAAETGNFTQAAVALGMTQPNVTGQIRSLEKELKIALFVRDGRQIHLTAAGLILKREVDDLLERSDNAVRLVQNAAESTKHLHIGGTMTAGGYVLPPLIADFLRQRNEVLFSLYIANTEEIEEQLKRHAFDLALVEGPFDETFFFSSKLLEDELVIAGHPDLSCWGEGDSLSVAGLLEQGMRLILRERGSGTRFYFEKFCRDHGVEIDSYSEIMEIAGFDALKRMLEERCGVTVISELAIRRELAEGRLRCARLAEGRIRRAMNFIYLDNDARQIAERFIAFCRESLRSSPVHGGA